MDLLKKYSINKDDIESISIFLDDNVPDYMDGRLRIGSVKISTNKKEIYINELVDNSEFTDYLSIENFVNKSLETNIATIIE